MAAGPSLDGGPQLHEVEPVCIMCRMRLNGPRQYEDHLRGKRHRKNREKLERANAAARAHTEHDDKHQDGTCLRVPSDPPCSDGELAACWKSGDLTSEE